MQRFHTPEYISYLSNYVSTGIVAKYDEIGLVRALKPGEERRADLAEMRLRQEYKVGDSTDCPAFNGLYDFCQLSAGASIDCARAIMSGKADVAINWGGGLHHAKKC
jgi:histone deacetylase 1/2